MNKNTAGDRAQDLVFHIHPGIAISIQDHSELVAPGRNLVVVGSGHGTIARFSAHQFRSSELHMIDLNLTPDEFEPEIPEHFYQMDVLSEEFLKKFEGTADCLMCFMVVHELKEPERGIRNMLKALSDKKGSHLWIMDLTGYRWTRMREEPIESFEEEYRQHVLDDLENVKRHRLDDQDRVFAMYDVIAQETGAKVVRSQVKAGSFGQFSDIYEVILTLNPYSEATT